MGLRNRKRSTPIVIETASLRYSTKRFGTSRSVRLACGGYVFRVFENGVPTLHVPSRLCT